MPLPRTIGTGRALLGSRNPLAYTNKVRSFAPLAYWPLADATGSVATDASGNGRNGTYSNVTLGVPGIGDGRTAASFNGTSSYVDIYAAISGVIPYDEGSISVWVRDTALDVSTRQAIGWRKPDVRWQLIQTDLKRPAISRAAVSVSDVTDFAPVWTHLCATWSVVGNSLKLYRNGVSVGTPSTAATISGAITVGWCNIGCLFPGAQHWGGDIAHAAVFNTPLSAAFVASLAVVL